MHLLNKFNLIFLLIVPILIPILIYRLINFDKMRYFFDSKNTHQKLFLKEIIKFMLLLLFLSLCIFSSTNPSFGKKTTEDLRQGQDIYIMLDISNSMLAKDSEVSRLELSITFLKTLMSQLNNSRFGLFVFKGDLQKIVPLTQDLNILLNTLSYINTSLYTSKGTDIKGALKDIFNSEFKEKTNRKQMLILISDGGDSKIELENKDIFSGNFEKYSKAIDFVVLGVGKNKSIKIKKDNNLIKDKYGNTVFTKLNKENFSNIIKNLDGKYFNLKDDSSIIDIINYFIQTNDKKTKIIYIENYNIILGFSITILIFYMLLKYIKI